jgi:hypothetical protein
MLQSTQPFVRSVVFSPTHFILTLVFVGVTTRLEPVNSNHLCQLERFPWQVSILRGLHFVCALWKSGNCGHCPRILSKRCGRRQLAMYTQYEGQPDGAKIRQCALQVVAASLMSTSECRAQFRVDTTTQRRTRVGTSFDVVQIAVETFTSNCCHGVIDPAVSSGHRTSDRD